MQIWLFLSCPLITRLYWKHQWMLSLLTEKWKSLSCVWLCNPMDCTVHGILPGWNTAVGCHPSSRAPSQPRDRTHVSHTAGGYFPSWAMRGAQGPICVKLCQKLFHFEPLSPSWSSDCYYWQGLIRQLCKTMYFIFSFLLWVRFLLRIRILAWQILTIFFILKCLASEKSGGKWERKYRVQ